MEEDYELENQNRSIFLTCTYDINLNNFLLHIILLKKLLYLFISYNYIKYIN